MRGEMNRWWRVGLAIVTPLVRALLSVRVEGAERVPSHGPAILAFNHVSVLDGPIVAIETARRVGRPTRFLVASEVYDGNAVVRWILRRYLQIPIRRGERDADALDEAVRTVRSGALAGIAPEGRVNDDPEQGLQRLRGGVARVALPTGAPVVPVGIWGTQDRWSKTGPRWRIGRRTRVAISFGSPILPTGEVADPEVVQAFSNRLRDALEHRVAVARSIVLDDLRR